MDHQRGKRARVRVSDIAQQQQQQADPESQAGGSSRIRESVLGATTPASNPELHRSSGAAESSIFDQLASFEDVELEDVRNAQEKKESEEPPKGYGEEQPPEPARAPTRARISTGSASRPSRGDRHTKVNTSKGLRDRRVRLSVPTAIQFYDIQDRLGIDQPSKVVEWLMGHAKQAIDELPPLPATSIPASPAVSARQKKTLTSSSLQEQLKSGDSVVDAALASLREQQTRGSGGHQSASLSDRQQQGPFPAIEHDYHEIHSGSLTSMLQQQQQQQHLQTPAAPAFSYTSLTGMLVPQRIVSSAGPSHGAHRLLDPAIPSSQQEFILQASGLYGSYVAHARPASSSSRALAAATQYPPPLPSRLYEQQHSNVPPLATNSSSSLLSLMTSISEPFHYSMIHASGFPAPAPAYYQQAFPHALPSSQDHQQHQQVPERIRGSADDEGTDHHRSAASEPRGQD